MSQAGLKLMCSKDAFELVTILPPPPDWQDHRWRSTVLSFCGAGSEPKSFLRTRQTLYQLNYIISLKENILIKMFCKLILLPILNYLIQVIFSNTDFFLVTLTGLELSM